MDGVEAPPRIRTMVLTSSRLVADALTQVLSKAAGVVIVTEDPEVVLVDAGAGDGAGDLADQYPDATQVVIDRNASPFDLVGAVLGRPTHAQPPKRARAGAGLTDREIEVLALLRSGLRGPEVAASLGISPHTVRSHLQSIRAKLGVRSQVEAVTTARRL